MSIYEIIGSILLIITCLLVTVAVLLQSSKSNGLSALGGKSESAGRASAKSLDARLCKITKVLAIVFFVITIGVYACNLYL